MKRLIFFLANIFCLWLFSDAQTIEKGIYFGNGNTDFMIVTDDTICYRLQTSFGMVYNYIDMDWFKTLRQATIQCLLEQPNSDNP